MRWMVWAATVPSVALALAGCQTTGEEPSLGPKTAIGGLGGAVAGGLLGAAAGGKGAGIVAGSLIGGLLGDAIGNALDDADRPYAAETAQRALTHRPVRR